VGPLACVNIHGPGWAVRSSGSPALLSHHFASQFLDLSSSHNGVFSRSPPIIPSLDFLVTRAPFARRLPACLPAGLPARLADAAFHNLLADPGAALRPTSCVQPLGHPLYHCGESTAFLITSLVTRKKLDAGNFDLGEIQGREVLGEERDQQRDAVSRPQKERKPDERPYFF